MTHKYGGEAVLSLGTGMVIGQEGSVQSRGMFTGTMAVLTGLLL
jgi:hypothetical protein